MVSEIRSFPWFGGKFKHRGFILPLLPESERYCEPFAGAASILLNRKPSAREYLNDLNADVCNFFRTLKTQGEPLIRKIVLTPHSRDAALRAAHQLAAVQGSDLERARCFFTIVKQSMQSAPEFDHRTARILKFRWRGMTSAIHTSMLRGTNSADSHSLTLAAARLAKVDILHGRAVEAIRALDSPDMLFYCDPPYVLASRTAADMYGEFEMSDEDHRELAEVLNNLQGKAAVSGYHSALYDRLYENWYVHEDRPKVPATSGGNNLHGTQRTEVLWTNYQVGL